MLLVGIKGNLMNPGIITKKKIAKSFKELISNSSVNDVSVSKLMKNVGMRRQSFYNHFIDIYDLIEWIFNQELSEIIQDNITYYSWKEVIEVTIIYFSNSKLYYNKIFKYTEQNNFLSYFKKYTMNLLRDIVNSNTSYENNNDEFLLILFTNAIVYTIYDWITLDSNNYIQNTVTTDDLIDKIISFIELLICSI